MERGQIKTLAVGWNPLTDTANFTVRHLQISGAFTKRSVLSKIAQIYDPLGLASAVTIKARVALQDIWWSKQFDWDDPLPEEIEDLWRNLYEDIEKLKGVKFQDVISQVLQVDCLNCMSSQTPASMLMHTCCCLHQMFMKFA